VVTALVVGLVAYVVFDLSFAAALLLGAVLAPTDPAILIPLFIGSRLRPKLAQTVVAESAFNDPTGAALALAGVVITGGSSVGDPVVEFALDLAVSTLIGVWPASAWRRSSRATGPVSGASPRRWPSWRSSPSATSRSTRPAAAATSGPSWPA
jgi:NhaP-type Na+/H+ or K+/H+ antiporter